MNKRITRRNLLKFVGGSAAGALLTPIPWKTLDDVAIWTQNWSWIPKPPKGEIRTKYNTCALCPVGCGLKARCVGEQPVSLSGVADHPISRGAVCPIGLDGHHLPFLPDRLLQPVRLVRREGGFDAVPISADAAVAALGRALSELKGNQSEGAVAILDERPGRITSRIYRRFLSGFKHGIYLVPAAAGGLSLDVLQSMFVEPCGPFGLDLERTGALVSFGAPILDGWGRPGRMMGIRKENPERPKLVQIETRQSRTASLADLWLPIKPGTETALALGLAHVLIKERLCDFDSLRNRAIDFEAPPNASYTALIESFGPDTVSRITGIGADRIREVARLAARNAPALAVGGGDPGGGPLGEQEETAIWGLNFLLGNIGTKGGMIPRLDGLPDCGDDEEQLAPITQISRLPDRSIRLLILDPAGSGGAIPWALVEKKLIPGKSLVVSLSPTLSGRARKADLVIPAPVHLETFQDIPSTPDLTVASFSVSAPMLAKPPAVIHPVDLVNRLASAAGIQPGEKGQAMTLAEHMQAQANEIYKARRGRVFSARDARWIEMTEVDSGQKLWKLLIDGACWVDAESDIRPLPGFHLLGKSQNAFDRLMAAGEGRLGRAAGPATAYPFVLMPYGWRGAVEDSLTSPLMTKLFQESGSRSSFNQAAVNPETGRALRLVDGGRAIVETAAGAVTVDVGFDESVMPGVICVAVGPLQVRSGKKPCEDDSILQICRLDQDSTWRVTPARVREA